MEGLGSSLLLETLKEANLCGTSISNRFFVCCTIRTLRFFFIMTLFFKYILCFFCTEACEKTNFFGCTLHLLVLLNGPHNKVTGYRGRRNIHYHNTSRGFLLSLSGEGGTAYFSGELTAGSSPWHYGGSSRHCPALSGGSGGSLKCYAFMVFLVLLIVF